MIRDDDPEVFAHLKTDRFLLECIISKSRSSKRRFIYNLVRSARYAALRTRSLPAGVSYFEGFSMYRWNSRASSPISSTPPVPRTQWVRTFASINQTLLEIVSPQKSVAFFLFWTPQPFNRTGLSILARVLTNLIVSTGHRVVNSFLCGCRRHVSLSSCSSIICALAKYLFVGLDIKTRSQTPSSTIYPLLVCRQHFPAAAPHRISMGSISSWSFSAAHHNCPKLKSFC